MSGVLSREWLLSETPASRTQAAWVRRYRGWLQFRANGLAMIGLVTVALMIVASLAAPLLAPQDPSAQDLAGRLARRRQRIGSAPTNLAAISTRASSTAGA